MATKESSATCVYDYYDEKNSAADQQSHYDNYYEFDSDDKCQLPYYVSESEKKMAHFDKRGLSGLAETASSPLPESAPKTSEAQSCSRLMKLLIALGVLLLLVLLCSSVLGLLYSYCYIGCSPVEMVTYTESGIDPSLFDSPTMPYNGHCEKDVEVGRRKQNLQFYGYPPDVETCIDACSYNPDCEFFVWHSSRSHTPNGCWLRSTYGMNYTEVPRYYKFGVTSGKPGCKPPDQPVCEFDRFIEGGDDVDYVSNTDSPLECQRKCFSAMDCQFWTWLGPETNDCSLWHTDDKDFLLLEHRRVHGAISGLWNCHF